MLTLIAAAGSNNELGKDNDLVWHLPDDFKRFKQLTTGHHIIMGRKTFESLPGILPGRPHVVISRNPEYTPSGAVAAPSLEAAIKIAEEDPQPFIIGGGMIYKLALPLAQCVELTRVHASFQADTFFPDLPAEEWELVWSEEHEADERHKYAFTYQRWVRK